MGGDSGASPEDVVLAMAAASYEATFDTLLLLTGEEDIAALAESGAANMLHEVADVVEESGFADVASELDNPEGPGVPAPGGQVDAATTITIGAGFTLLRLTGRIDEDGRLQTLRALDVLIHRYDSPPQLVRQRRDLESWAG